MDPRKQKQMVSQLFDSTAKSQEELDKMTPDERKEYLRGRLKQRMFFNGASRQSMQQKKKMQEKMEEATNETGEGTEAGAAGAAGAEGAEVVSKNKKKKEKKRAAKAAAAKAVADGVIPSELKEAVNDDDDDIVIVKRDSESDYESDEN